MSEEASNPRTTIPWALITSITLNGFLGFGMIVALLYCQGDFLQNLNSETGFPFLEAFMQSLRSFPWATAYTIILLVLLIFANVAVLAATSRTTYAFARYDILPNPRASSDSHTLHSLHASVIVTTSRHDMHSLT